MVQRITCFNLKGRLIKILNISPYRAPCWPNPVKTWIYSLTVRPSWKKKPYKEAISNLSACDLVPAPKPLGELWLKLWSKSDFESYWSVKSTLRRIRNELFRVSHKPSIRLYGQSANMSGLENREYGRGDPLRWPRDTLYPQKLAITSPTGCGRSVGIVRLRTEATEFVFCFVRRHG
jgi:hypothetical protein